MDAEVKSLRGDLWQLADEEVPFGKVAVCITTNGDVNRFGQAVMGRGVALEAKTHYPSLAGRLGSNLRSPHGNIVYLFREEPYDIITFPVKHHWHEEADPELIVRSAHQLEALAGHSDLAWDVILLPRPGCGNGGLDWADVKPLIDFLDDRFYEVTR